MTSILVSKRLQQIADYCPVGMRVADIGSDHALLSAYLLVQNIASFVVLGELNEGPYQAARNQINALQAGERASVRKGDGLAVLAPNEVDVICIAGMGGQLIAAILEAGKDKLAGVTRLVLQPNVGEEIVRRWLLQNNWQLVAESILEEEGVIYEILVAEQGDPQLPYIGKDRPLEELLRLGPYLWQSKPAALAKKWEREKAKAEYIYQQVSQSKRAAAQDRLHEIKREIEWINEVIRCLRTDKPSFNT